MHYLRVRYGIHPLSLGVSMPATAIPRLPPGLTTRGTAELRRRIITFYTDFNTRLRPVPSVPPCLRLVGIVSPLSPRYRISNRRFRDIVRSNSAENSPLFLVLHIMRLFSPPPFIEDAISSTIESNVSVGRDSRS